MELTYGLRDGVLRGARPSNNQMQLTSGDVVTLRWPRPGWEAGARIFNSVAARS
jgi:hypothetical protein